MALEMDGKTMTTRIPPAVRKAEQAVIEKVENMFGQLRKCQDACTWNHIANDHLNKIWPHVERLQAARKAARKRK